MSAISDHVQIMKSTEQPYQTILSKKEWVYVNDTNQQYDQSTSIIETTALASNNGFVDYNAGYLSIPLLVTVSSGSSGVYEGVGGADPLRLVGFKNSFLSMINSLTIDCNGQSLVQQNQLIDLYNHFRLLTSESFSSSNRWATIGFYPDLVGNSIYLSTDNFASSGGVVANNTQENEGITTRMDYINFADKEIDGHDTILGSLLNKEKLQNLYINHLSKIDPGNDLIPAILPTPPGVDADGNPTPGDDGRDEIKPKHAIFQYSVRAVVMLKDLHPLFEAMPLSKHLNFKIQLFYNNTAFSVNHDESAYTGYSLSYKAFNGTVPLTIASLNLHGGSGGTIRASVYVGNTCYDSIQNQLGAAAGAVGNLVQLWVPVYQMRPEQEQSYTASPIKTVKFNDYYQYNIKNIGPSHNFNQLVSNAISNLKAVLIIPTFSTLNNHQNPFDDGLPSLFGHIENFNVFVGGTKVLHLDSRYTYQTFLHEFFNEFGVNANQSKGLGSGLIGFREWNHKPYYYVNCSRMPEDTSRLFRSLQIAGVNASKVHMDYLVYAIYEKEIEINVETGAIDKKDN